MICEKCSIKNECDWFLSYQRIKNEICMEIGTDNPVGAALMVAIEDNQLTECEYFEL